MAPSLYSWSVVGLVALAAGPGLVRSLSMDYCASINTAQTPTNSSIYQSDGLCQVFCNKDSWAFAIVQAFDCWCSDYIPFPDSQVDTAKCNRACPGWPDDTCGAKGLYGYILLDSQPSGTKSDDSGPSPTATPTGSTSSSVNVSSRSTSVTHATTTGSSTTPSQSEPEKNPTSPPASSKEVSSTGGTTIKTITEGGGVSIVTVVPTPTKAPGDGSGNEAKGLNSGAIAGIVIGILGVIAIASVAIFLMLRKRREREEELGSRPNSHESGSPGAMSTPTTAMASVWDGENTSTGRRSSRLMPHDPRMDPFATNIYSRFENKSRESINTLQDNQDYSRKVLRTTNPDPDDE